MHLPRNRRRPAIVNGRLCYPKRPSRLAAFIKDAAALLSLTLFASSFVVYGNELAEVFRSFMH